MSNNPFFRVTVMLTVVWLLAACSGSAGRDRDAGSPSLLDSAGQPRPAATQAAHASEAVAVSAPLACCANMEFAEEQPAAGPPADMFFQEYGFNPFVETAADNLSTFAVDVDTGSYTVMRRYLLDGLLPPAEAVRVEEFVNYFRQEYARPEEEAFAIHLEGAPSAFGEGLHLVRIGIQGYNVAPEARPDANLIFVIDVSGSMAQEDRLGLVKQSLARLLDSLRPTDRIGIVVYGTTARVVLEPTYVDARRSIQTAIDSLEPEGSTNAEQGLAVAYRMAERAADPEQINRLILLSDGVANVGNTTAETILEHAREGIYLSTFGFGMGNYNDVLMEQLADQGNGAYAYVDSLQEAERVFGNHLTSTILTIARDAKIQVEFNPAVVSRYRLLGYENREVADEDFRNDAVDAGEIGAGHSVTALYEVEWAAEAPAGQAALTVYVRYAEPESGEVNEIARSAGREEFAGRFEQASPRFQLAAVVAEFAEVLRQSSWAEGSSLAGLAADAGRIAEYLPDDADVQELASLIGRAAELGR